MSTLPSWAQKPKHKKEVVATPRGWMVRETGEYLKLIRGLDERLKALETESSEVAQSVVEPFENNPVSTYSDDAKDAQSDGDEAEKVSEETTPVQQYEPKKKRPGRPRKNTKE